MKYSLNDKLANTNSLFDKEYFENMNLNEDMEKIYSLVSHEEEYNEYEKEMNLSKLRIDNHNQGLINNFWVADVQLRITDRVQYTYNTAITNFPDDPTRDGYTFEGWYTDPYGGTKVENTLVVRESQTLYAHWS